MNMMKDLNSTPIAENTKDVLAVAFLLKESRVVTPWSAPAVKHNFVMNVDVKVMGIHVFTADIDLLQDLFFLMLEFILFPGLLGVQILIHSGLGEDLL